jgi:hypothetical protein
MDRAALLVAFAGLPALAQFNIHLSPQTLKAFDEYVAGAEKSMDWKPRFTTEKPGEIRVDPVARDGAIDVPSGMIHDWSAAAIAPRASVAKVLNLLQNYAAYQHIYAPEIAESHLLKREGSHWYPRLQLVKRKGITVRLNSDFDVEYRPLDDGRWAVLTHSTRIAQLSGKDELEPDTGGGFLWRLNSYWLIEPRPEGAYLEFRTISLTRDIPSGLGWVIRPMVNGLPRESLQKTLEATLRALH